MHIPSSMLQGAICPVTATVAGTSIAVAGYMAYRSKEKPAVEGFAAVTAMIFAAQMLNFPINHGTSGHLLGGVLAVSLLGIPFAILSMGIVLAVQAIFFGDGGINTLGANIINMGLIGAGLSGLIHLTLKKKGVDQFFSLVLASWASVVLATLACSLELGFSNADRLGQILSAMVPVHAIIGIGEASLSAALVFAISRKGKVYLDRSFKFGALLVMASPLASPLPDGLEWVSSHLRLAAYQNVQHQAIFSDYQVGFISLSFLSTIAAALAGIMLVFILSLAVAGLTVKGGEPCKTSI